MTGNLTQALAAIDEANSADPKGEALDYGKRMTWELTRPHRGEGAGWLG